MGSRTLFVLGGTGFVGRETIRAAVAAGWRVRALARSPSAADRLRALGAEPIVGDAAEPGRWIAATASADALVDLVQPALPRRIRRPDIAAVSRARQAATRALAAALASLPARSRPWLVSVSGTDDLATDAQGRIGAGSPVRDAPTGFGAVGVPVRRLLEASGLAVAFVVLGTVYGPGKSFAASILPDLARGRLLLPGPASNRLPLVHVEDAGRAIVHLAGLGRERAAGRTWVVVDEAGGAPLGALLDVAAEGMGVAPPRRIPAWLLAPVVGEVLLETLTRDAIADPGPLLATGFRFSFPSVREGMPATLRALGLARPPAGAARAVRPEGGQRRLAALVAVAAAAVAAVNGLDLPLGVRRLRALAGGEAILDLRLGYRPADADRLLQALGASGRARYLAMLWTIDLVLPLLFAAVLWTALGQGRLRRWRWIGPAAAAMDWLENGAITVLLASYPGRLDAVAWAASALTAAKFLLYGVGAALAVAGLVSGGGGVASSARRPVPATPVRPPP